MTFEWNPEKATANQTKHGVSFDEARTVFADPLHVFFDDPIHSDEEEREIAIGTSHSVRLLFVSYTRRDDSIRIISARETTKGERNDYENS